MKKTFKRAISLMAVFTLVFALCIPAFAATTYTKVTLSGSNSVLQGHNIAKDYKITVNDETTEVNEKFTVDHNVYDVFYEDDTSKTWDYTDGKVFAEKTSYPTYNPGHDYIDEIILKLNDVTDEYDAEVINNVSIVDDKNNTVEVYNSEFKDGNLVVRRLDSYSVKVVYDLGSLKSEATAPVDKTLYQPYAKVTVAAAPEIDGYEFNSWKVEVKGETKTVKVGEEIEFSEVGTYTFVADYTAKTPAPAAVTISFDANGKKFKKAIESITVDLGKEATLPSAVSDNTAYEFVSWNTKADGKGTAYKAGAKFSCSEDTTLYATWNTVTKGTIYTLTFNKNCDNSLVYTPDTLKAPADGKIHFRTVMTRSGYKHAGWSTNPDGTGDKYKTEDDIVMTSDITLYAIWDKLDDKNTTTTKPTTTKQDDTTTTTKKETTTTKPTTTRPTTTKPGVKDETTVPNTGSSVAMAVVASVALVAACAAILVVTKKNKEEKTEA